MVDIVQILVYSAKILFVMIILIMLIVISKRKELKPDCEKGFLNGFMIFLILLLFQRIFDYSVRIIMDYVLEPQGYNISFFPYFLFLISMNVILFSIIFVRNIVLFDYIERKLFYMKTKLKSFSVAFTLRYLIYFVNITSLFLIFFTILRRISLMDYNKFILVGGIINNSLVIIIGIIFIRFLILTTKEKPETRKYSIWLSIGFAFLFIFTPIISYGIEIINYISNKGFNEEIIFDYETLSTLNQIFVLTYNFLYGIGLIISAIGAYKTTQVPLFFAKIEREKTRTEEILKKYNYELKPEHFKEEN